MGDGSSKQLKGEASTSPPAVATGSHSPSVVTTSNDATLATPGAPNRAASSESSYTHGQQQQQTYYNVPQLHLDSASSINMPSQSPSRPQSFNMASMGAALPDHAYAPYGQHPQSHHGHPRFSPGPSVPAIAYQIHQVSQYAGQAAMAQQQSGQPPYNITYQQQQYSPVYPPNQQMPQTMHSPSTSQFFPSHAYPGAPGQQQQVPSYYYSAGQYGQQGQVYPNPSYQSVGRSGSSAELGTGDRSRSSERSSQGYGSQSPRIDRQGSTTSQSSAPRGPPRKPKQSGHALWVGNLPPGTNVVDLKDHFSRDATETIESVFLISKSNCAFVNYKTETACAAAMTRFHDSRFQGVRLVCRLRRSSVNTASSVPTGPAAANPQPAGKESDPDTLQVEGNTETTPQASAASPGKISEKFFVVKSLTIEDLELSVRNGIWATQSHNEETLNNAFKAADNVYLIFSANKSGEYFGYARMISPINDDPAAAIEFAPKSQVTEDSDLPKAIPTPATEFAPKGRVIDDSARGTIFWEAESTESDTEDAEESEDPDAEPKTWGKPFKVEWMSTTKLPFYRTRGMRNPWNSNREVKIARDGTELETSVGRRLLTMFHRDPSPNPSQGQMMPGVPMGPMMGRFNQQGQY